MQLVDNVHDTSCHSSPVSTIPPVTGLSLKKASPLQLFNCMHVPKVTPAIWMSLVHCSLVALLTLPMRRVIITWRIEANEPCKKGFAFTTESFGVQITRVDFDFGVDFENWKRTSSQQILQIKLLDALQPSGSSPAGQCQCRRIHEEPLLHNLIACLTFISS